MRDQQEAVVTRLFKVARRNRPEFLLEIIPSKVGEVDDETTASLIRRFYQIGIYPDWWKLEPMSTVAASTNTCGAIIENDKHVRGIVVLGLDAPETELSASFRVAAGFDLVKGFAVGRTIFGTVAEDWFARKITDEQTVAEMKRRYQRLCEIWDRCRCW